MADKRGLTYAEIEQACRNIGYDLSCGACASQFYTGSTLGPHTCARATKYGIAHPSGRPLGIGYDGSEMWGAEKPLLFNTEAEARAHIAKRSSEYPNGDWPHALPAKYTPGVPRVYSKWETLPI